MVMIALLATTRTRVEKQPEWVHHNFIFVFSFVFRLFVFLFINLFGMGWNNKGKELFPVRQPHLVFYHCK